MSTCARLVSNHLHSMKDNLHPSHLSGTIWVFRTSVKMQVDIRRLKPILDRLMHEGDKWNFDLEDCDHILRVETKSLSAPEIIYQMEKAGYQCAELEDDYDFAELTHDPSLAIVTENTISSRSKQRYDLVELTPFPSLTL